MVIAMIEDDHSHGDGNGHDDSYRTFVLSCFPIQIWDDGDNDRW